MWTDNAAAAEGRQTQQHANRLSDHRGAKDKMSAMIGILLDVSGSMKRNVPQSINHSGGSWARSIFRTVDELVRHDVSSETKVFSIAFGARETPDICDFLNTVRRAKEFKPFFKEVKGMKNRASNFQGDVFNKILDMLETDAPYIRSWTSANVIESFLSKEDAQLFWAVISEDESFRRRFAQHLPERCRERSLSGDAMRVARWLPWVGEVVGDVADVTTSGSVKDVVEIGENILRRRLSLDWAEFAMRVSVMMVMDIKTASGILHECIDEKDLTNSEVEELLEMVEPYIYGGTPMMSALCEAWWQMRSPLHQDKKKVLFILSDGEAADIDKIRPPDLSQSGVHVVCCFITDSDIADPKHLYHSPCCDWDKGAKTMFSLSTSMKVQDLPRTIFVEHGWKVDFETNEVKLFLQVNHPDMIGSICNFAKDIVCSQDVLSDFLTSAHLDSYINKKNYGFEPQQQKGDTCYAHAAATVMHLLMHQVVGREGGYPEFLDLREELIRVGGQSGANTFKVLQKICPEYRLRCRQVNVIDALKAVIDKRPVLAKFSVTRREATIFNSFCGNEHDVLTKDVIDIQKRPAQSNLEVLIGHAVVLTSFKNDRLIFMNSMGSDWGNNGFFSVRDASVLKLQFIEVQIDHLTASEKEAYKRDGPRIADKLMTSLKGLRTARYTCPLCKRESSVREFSGQLVRATCPRCLGVFDTRSEDAHDLVLNMYLTSMCRPEQIP